MTEVTLTHGNTPGASQSVKLLLLIGSSAGFPPSAYVIPPPVAFPGLQVNPGFTFSTGVSVPGPFLQPGVHTQAGAQAGKQSHIPYSQQRPSGPGPGQGPGSSGPSQGQQPQTQPPSQQALQQSVQLQVQVMSQQQQSPTKPVQQVGMGKSPPHHPGLQQVSTLPVILAQQLLQSQSQGGVGLYGA